MIDEHNLLIDRYNKINNELYSIVVPKLILIRNKQKNIFISDLNRIKKEADTLQKDYLFWRGKANAFCVKPKFILPTEKGDLLFLHYIGVLKHMIQGMDYIMAIMLRNHTSIRSSYENEYNFQIALLALFFSLIGLYLSLFYK